MVLLDREARRGSDLLRMCGWRKPLDVAGRWRELEDAIA
jgi:hypothetical protein